MSIYICPVTTIQYRVEPDYNQDLATLLPHPCSNSRQAILNIPNNLKLLTGILVHHKILTPLQDISEYPQRNKLISALNLSDAEINRLIQKLGIKSRPGINTDNPKILANHLRKIINENMTVDSVFVVNNNKDVSYDSQRKRANQILNCLTGLLKGTKFYSLACPQDRRQAKLFAQKITSNSDRANKVKALLIELSDNVAFQDVQPKGETL